jgi:XTP/dITP diphosphohydrolase
MLPSDIVLSGLDGLIVEDLPETSDTLRGNALEKARYVHTRLRRDCFADDTGLDVPSLGGAPGIYSARYAGISCDSSANIRKLLSSLSGNPYRAAYFRTVLALILCGEEYIFEGVLLGSIAESSRGAGGFGYDAVFIPAGYDRTLAELGDDIKNGISHRAGAIYQMVKFLSTRN